MWEEWKSSIYGKDSEGRTNSPKQVPWNLTHPHSPPHRTYTPSPNGTKVPKNTLEPWIPIMLIPYRQFQDQLCIPRNPKYLVENCIPKSITENLPVASKDIRLNVLTFLWAGWALVWVRQKSYRWQGRRWCRRTRAPPCRWPTTPPASPSFQPW